MQNNLNVTRIKESHYFCPYNNLALFRQMHKMQVHIGNFGYEVKLIPSFLKVQNLHTCTFLNSFESI